MLNIFNKSILIVVALVCMTLLLTSKSVILITLAGLLFVMINLILDAIVIKNSKKTKFEEHEIYLNNQKIEKDLNRNNSCGIIGGIKPVIVMDEHMFNTMEYNQKRAVFLTKQYFIEYGYTLKKILFVLTIIALYVLARYIPMNKSIEYIALFATFTYFISYYLYHRKEVYAADAFAVRKMGDSKPLVDFLESCLEQDEKIILRLEPSIRARIKKIKANLD